MASSRLPSRALARCAALLALAALSLATPAPAKKRAPAACPAGRFLLHDHALVAGGAVLPDAIVLEGDGFASIASGCPPVAAKVKARRRGTSVRATWAAGACRELRGRVRLRGTVDAACTTLRGTLRAKKYRQRFAARRSMCGDGHPDLAAGETCDLPPVPPTLALELAAAHATTATIGADGGMLETVGPDGTRFALTVPAGALAHDTAIMLTPVAAIPNLPMQGGLVAAADLAPDGLELLVPAVLAVTPAVPVDRAALAAFGYRGDGEGLHLALVQASATTLVFHPTHFSGVGVGHAAPADLAAIAAQPNTPADAAAVHALLALAAAGETAPGPYAAVLRDWYDASVGPLLAAAGSGDAALLAALHEWVRFGFVAGENMLLALGLPFDVDALHGADGFAVANRREAGAALLAAGLRAAIVRATADCRASQALARAEDALRWQRIARALGLDESDYGLDLARVLADFCVEVVYEAVSYPQLPQPGVAELLVLNVGYRIGGGPVRFDRDLAVTVRPGGTVEGRVDGVADFGGSFVRGFTPLGDREVTLDVTTCLLTAPEHGALDRMVCQVALVVRGELAVEPAAVSLAPGGTQQFDAIRFGLPTAAVTWTATGGTITPGGLFTAGTEPGRFAVTATGTGAGDTATAAVEIGEVGFAVSAVTLSERASAYAVYTHQDMVGQQPTIVEDAPPDYRPADVTSLAAFPVNSSVGLTATTLGSEASCELAATARVEPGAGGAIVMTADATATARATRQVDERPTTSPGARVGGGRDLHLAFTLAGAYAFEMRATGTGSGFYTMAVRRGDANRSFVACLVHNGPRYRCVDGSAEETTAPTEIATGVLGPGTYTVVVSWSVFACRGVGCGSDGGPFGAVSSVAEDVAAAFTLTLTPAGG